MTPKTRRTLTVLARIGASSGLLALLALVVDVRSTTAILLTAHPGFVAAAIAVAYADRAVMIGKWYPLLRLQLPAFPVAPAARAYLAAGFAAIFLPASAGADILRAVALGRRRSAVPEVGASIVVERLLGMLASGVMSLVALALAVRAGVRLEILLPWAVVAILAALLLCAAPFSSRIRAYLARRSEPAGRIVTFLRRLGTAYLLYHHHPRTLLGVGLVSLLEQGLPTFVLWLLARALGTSITFEMLLVAVPLTLFVGRLPIAMWSLGVTEGSLVYLLGLFEVAPSEALALALAGRAAELVVLLPGALFWFELVKSPPAPATTPAAPRA